MGVGDEVDEAVRLGRVVRLERLGDPVDRLRDRPPWTGGRRSPERFPGPRPAAPECRTSRSRPAGCTSPDRPAGRPGAPDRRRNGPSREYSVSPSADRVANPRALSVLRRVAVSPLPSRATTTPPLASFPSGSPTQRDPLALARKRRSRGRPAGGGAAQPTSAGARVSRSRKWTGQASAGASVMTRAGPREPDPRARSLIVPGSGSGSSLSFSRVTRSNRWRVGRWRRRRGAWSPRRRTGRPCRRSAAP